MTAGSSAAPASPTTSRHLDTSRSAVAMLGPVAVAAAAAPVGEPDAFLHVVRVEEQHSVAGQGSSQEPMPVDSGVTYFDDFIDRIGWLGGRRTGDQPVHVPHRTRPNITSLATDPGRLGCRTRDQAPATTAQMSGCSRASATILAHRDHRRAAGCVGRDHRPAAHRGTPSSRRDHQGRSTDSHPHHDSDRGRP